MKFFKGFMIVLTSLTFICLFLAMINIFKVQPIFIIGMFSVFILEILFLLFIFGDSTYYIKVKKIENLTEQYKKTLKKLETIELKNKVYMEESDKQSIKTISSSEIVQEIFKSYANAMADI